jgi:D-alanine transfer protein
MRFPRLFAAGVAIVLAVMVIAAVTARARHLEHEYIYALAPRLFSLRTLGTALQAEAFRRPDLLPLFGGSELLVPNRYHPNALLRDYPTGFTTFPVGMPGNQLSILMLQKVAALGEEVRGKKIVISLPPSWFFFYDKTPADAYAANFSRLQAGALVFSRDLSWDLKRASARRMLEYPETLAGDPILRFGLHRLASGSSFDRLLYDAVRPLGMVQNAMLRLQDHWATFKLIRDRASMVAAEPRQRRVINWDALRSEAETLGAIEAGDNPFGFNKVLWQEQEEKWRNRRLSDDGFAAGMERSKEWVDLDLLLSSLEQLGARPLVLSMPTCGLFLDHLGTSAASRQAFYSRLQSMIESHHARVITFAEHDRDKYFITDPGDHLGPRGWIFYVQALDNFYHETLP